MGSQDFHLSLHCRLTADSPSQGKGESCESQSLWKQWQGGARMHIGFFSWMLPFSNWERNCREPWLNLLLCGIANHLYALGWKGHWKIIYSSPLDNSTGARASAWLCSWAPSRVSSVSQDCGRINSSVKPLGGERKDLGDASIGALPVWFFLGTCWECTSSYHPSL